MKTNKQMNKELSKEEIYNKYCYDESKSAIVNAMQEYADQEKKKEAIAAMDWLRKQRPDVFYGRPTSEQLYELLNQQK